MKNLQFSYTMKTIFLEEIIDHSFTLKCIPVTNAMQHIYDLEVHLSPEVSLSIDTDSFGNQKIYGKIAKAHDLFVVNIKGSARVRGYPILEEAGAGQWIYKYPTKYTKMGPKLNRLYQESASKLKREMAPEALAMQLIEVVYTHMKYVQAVTGVETTAEEALTLGKGVCQDYAHILIALCRQLDIPARYAVGMMQGEGESHAWVELYADGCWYGLDPTNRKMVDDTYIKISHGRDYQDCLVERGIFKGNASQQKVVGVKVRTQ